MTANEHGANAAPRGSPDSRPAPRASCTWVTRARRYLTFCWRATRAAASSCASRTPTPSAASQAHTEALLGTCAGSGSSGTRVRIARMRAARTASRSAARSMRAISRSWSSAPPSIPASARRSSWSSRAARSSPPASRRATPAPAAICRRRSARRSAGAGPARDAALPRPAGRARRVRGLRARAAELSVG